MVLSGMVLASMHGIVRNGIGLHDWYCQEWYWLACMVLSDMGLASMHGIGRNGIG